MTAVGVRPGPGGGAAEGVGARSSDAGDGGCSRLSYTKLDVAVRDGRWELSRQLSTRSGEDAIGAVGELGGLSADVADCSHTHPLPHPCLGILFPPWPFGFSNSPSKASFVSNNAGREYIFVAFFCLSIAVRVLSPRLTKASICTPKYLGLISNRSPRPVDMSSGPVYEPICM